MLEAQKLIKRIEAEAAKELPRTSLAQFRSRHYGVDDSSSADGRFITAVSAITCNPAQGWW